MVTIADNGLPNLLSGKEPACQHRRCKRGGFNPWVRTPLAEEKALEKQWRPRQPKYYLIKNRKKIHFKKVKRKKDNFQINKCWICCQETTRNVKRNSSGRRPLGKSLTWLASPWGLHTVTPFQNTAWKERRRTSPVWEPTVATSDSRSRTASSGRSCGDDRPRWDEDGSSPLRSSSQNPHTLFTSETNIRQIPTEEQATKSCLKACLILSRSSKTRKVWEMVTSKGSLRRHDGLSRKNCIRGQLGNLNNEI